MALADGHVFATDKITDDLTEYSMADILAFTHLSTESIREFMRSCWFPKPEKSWALVKRNGQMKKTRRERWNRKEVDLWWANYIKEEKECGQRITG